MHRAHSRYATDGDGEAALIGRHAALIDRAARRIAYRTGGAVTADDLWSSGALGLLDASRRFEPGRDVRFETFAEHRIRGAMLDELRRLDHLPRRLRTQADDVEKARARLAQSLGREPVAEELAAEAKLDLEEVESVLGISQPALPVAEELESALPGGEDVVAAKEMSRALSAAVALLPERLQLVLSRHYVEGLTNREIAKVLEVSEPRVCQLHAEAVAELRHAFPAAGR